MAEDELLIEVDESDNVIGSVGRLKAHLDDGILHRGVMVTIKNYENRILLTQRSAERPDLGFPPPFPNFWDITLAGHPRWGQDDYVTQMAIEVQEELGIETKAEEIEYTGKFQYFAPDPSYPNPESDQSFRLSEREICGVGIVHTEATPILNRLEVQDSMWVTNKE